VPAHFINNGNCFNFAYFLYLKLHRANPVTFYSTPTNGGHAFIKIHNRFYDSDTPTGTSDWRDLHAIYDKQVAPTDAFPQKHDIFIKYWNLNLPKIRKFYTTFTKTNLPAP
jgi:hypothetical protein